MWVGTDKRAAGSLTVPFASPAPAGSTAAQSFARPCKSLREFSLQCREIALHATCPADQDMVRSRHSFRANHGTRQFAKTALHPVAHHGVSDLLCHRDPKPHCRITVFAPAHQQHKAGRCHPACCVGGQKVRPLSNRNQAESFLRPRARRARITARPPTVAIRARKPWRRARTRLLG